MINLGDREITEHEVIWGVRWDDGEVTRAADEKDAREMASLSDDSEVVAREVFRTAWASI